MRSVRSNRVNFRQAPAAEAAVLFTADQHYPVLVLERKRGWAKIRDFEGEIAWVAKRLLTSQKTVAVIAKGVSARQQPNDEAPASFQAPWSEGFVVVRVASDWVLVQDADNRQGWIHRMFLWGSVPAYKPPAQP